MSLRSKMRIVVMIRLSSSQLISSVTLELGCQRYCAGVTCRMLLGYASVTDVTAVAWMSILEVVHLCGMACCRGLLLYPAAA